MTTVFVALPSYSRMVPQMVNAFYRAVLSAGIQPFLHYHVGDTLISRVRNAQATAFLQTNCEWYFQISDDIEIMDCGPDRNIFKMLMAHGKEFIGGLYAPSMPSERRCTSELADDSGGCPGGLVRVKYLSGGCWLMRREVMERMARKYSGEAYMSADGERVGVFNEMVLRGFMGGLKVRRHLSEDFAFCKRWRDLGGEIWADPAVKLRHWGMYPYTYEHGAK